MTQTRPLQIDETVNCSCQNCTACCDQPWHTEIDADKAHALDAHDFSPYPQLQSRPFYTPSAAGRNGYYDLAKGKGTRCLFLDADRLCIIHKELGPHAKPDMCRQFPFIAAHTWADDRVSANYGCPAVQRRHGTGLTQQAQDITDVVPLPPRPPDPDGPTVLDARTLLTPAEGDTLFRHAIDIFDPDHPGDLWSRFAQLLTMLLAIREHKPAPSRQTDWIEHVTAQYPLANPLDIPTVTALANPAQAPMPARFLFAATLFPDTVPADATHAMGLFKRLAVIPKLLSLASVSGTYHSRLLNRDVTIDQVINHPIEPALPEPAHDLLVRYFRSRLWQRFPAGTKLTVIAGVHQHIQDLNAIIFLAKADAQHQAATTLHEPIIRQALTRVEFHLANQNRLYNQTLTRWIKARLNDYPLAFQSLRLLAPHR